MSRKKFSKRLEKPWAAYTFALCCAVVLYLFLSNISLLGRGLAQLYHYIQPVFIGLVLAYVTYPLVHFFETQLFRWKDHPKAARGLSIAVTYIIIVAAIVLILVALIPQLISSVRLFMSNISTYSDQISSSMSALNDFAAQHNVDITKYTSAGSDFFSVIISKLPGSLDGILNNAISYGKDIVNLVISSIIGIYFQMDKERLLAGTARLRRALFNERQNHRTSTFLGRCNTIMMKYILCDLLDGFIVGAATAVFMLIARYPYVPLISIVAGVTNLAPTFGPILGMVIGCGILVLINPWYGLVYLIFALALQTVDGYVLKPKMFGDTLGIPSIWVLVSIIVFGRMFGVAGILLAIPFAAIIHFLYHDEILPALERRKVKREANQTGREKMERGGNEEAVHEEESGRREDAGESRAADQAENSGGGAEAGHERAGS